MRKKILTIAIALTALALPSAVFAAPTEFFLHSTTTPGCLEMTSSGLVWSTGSSCGTGAGGGGGAGAFLYNNSKNLNYPATTTSYFVIGGSATTSDARLQVVGTTTSSGLSVTSAFSFLGDYITDVATWFSSKFTSNLAATTSVKSIATLPSLSLPLSQTTGTLPIANGGTNNTSIGASSTVAISDGSKITYQATSSLGLQNRMVLTTTGSSGASTFDGTTLNIPQYSGGTGTVSTSTSETSGYVPYWTTTSATPALLGSDSGFQYSAAAKRLTITYASSTGETSAYSSSTDSHLGKLTVSNLADGCANWTSGVAGSTGSPCGSGSSSFGQAWNVFGNNSWLAPTTTKGIIVSASSTAGNGTVTGGLNVFGDATTTGTLHTDTIVGITSPSIAVDLFKGQLDDSSNLPSIDFSSRTSLKFGGYTSNGFVKTSGGNGTLTVDTNTYSTAGYPFTAATNYGATNQATTGIAWLQNGLNASSTSHFDNSSTTVASSVIASSTDGRFGKLTVSNTADGCATFSSGVLGSIGSACGSSSGSPYPFPGTGNSTTTTTGFSGGITLGTSAVLDFTGSAGGSVDQIYYNPDDGFNIIGSSQGVRIASNNTLATAVRFNYSNISGSYDYYLAPRSGEIVIGTSTGAMANAFVASSSQPNIFPQASTTQLSISSLATPAGSILAVGPDGLVGVTTTPSGGGSSSVGPINTLQASDGAGGFIATGTASTLTVNSLTSTTTNLSRFSGAINVTADPATFASNASGQLLLAAATNSHMGQLVLGSFEDSTRNYWGVAAGTPIPNQNLFIANYGTGSSNDTILSVSGFSDAVGLGYGVNSGTLAGAPLFIGGKTSNTGRVGISSTSPSYGFAIGTSTYIGGSTAGGTLADLYIPNIANCSSATSAVGADAVGKLVCDTSLSDGRVKTDLVDLDGQSILAGIMKMRPITYHYNDYIVNTPQGRNQNLSTSTEQIGLVAQDLLALGKPFSDAVGTTSIIDRYEDVEVEQDVPVVFMDYSKTGMNGVPGVKTTTTVKKAVTAQRPVYRTLYNIDYPKLAPILISAIGEQQREISGTRWMVAILSALLLISIAGSVVAFRTIKKRLTAAGIK